MTPEEEEAARKAKVEAETHGADPGLPPPPTGVQPPAVLAGTSYAVPGVNSGPANVGGVGAPTPPPFIEPNAAGAGGGGAGAIANDIRDAPPPPPTPPPPPAVTGAAAGELPSVSRTTTAPPVVAGRTTTGGVPNSSEFTDLQRQAAAAIQNTLSGQAPSLAELQARQGFNRLASQQLSQAAGARGRSLASANRLAANNIAQLGAQQQAQGAQLRAQEVAQARGELAALGTAARGQDIQVETSDAELRLKAAIASDDREYGASVENARNAMTAVGLDDKYADAWMGRWLELRDQNNTVEIAKMQRDMAIWLHDNPAAKDFWDKLQSIGGLVGGAGQAVGGAAEAGAFK